MLVSLSAYAAILTRTRITGYVFAFAVVTCEAFVASTPKNKKTIVLLFIITIYLEKVIQYKFEKMYKESYT